ncbi:MAG: hypothetical protein U9Q31_01740 [Chloroflexota bacterium]|nr:hypothetical protein [Chloroflexota bacterium]
MKLGYCVAEALKASIYPGSFSSSANVPLATSFRKQHLFSSQVVVHV